MYLLLPSWIPHCVEGEGGEHGKMFKVGLSGVRKAHLPTNLAVNCLFLYLNPAAVHLCRYGPHAQQLLKLRGNGGSGQQQRQWLQCRPTLQSLLPPRSSILSSASKEKVGGERPASELRHCLRQSSREFHWLGSGYLPIQLQWPESCSLHCWEVTTVGKGGSCGDNGGHATPRSRDVCSEGICHRYHLSVGRFLSGDIFSVRLIFV